MIKSDARRAMRFCGGRTVAAMMAVLLAYLAVNLAESFTVIALFGMDVLLDYGSYAIEDPFTAGITFGFCVLWFLVIPQILIGYKKLHFSFAEGNDESISVIFERFSSFKKYIGSFFFGIGYGLRILLSFAISVLPGGAFLWFAESYIPEGNRTLSILKISACGIAVTIIILCIALWIIFIQRWSLAVYYYAEGAGTGKSFSLSAKASKGIHTRILSFKFSFIGWGILSLLILPLIWAVPYYELSNAIFAKYLMERYERSLAEVPEIIETEEELTEEKD